MNHVQILIGATAVICWIAGVGFGGLLVWSARR